MIPDPALRGSDFNGFAGKDCELFWSTGVYEIPNSKHQITNKSQIPISNDRNRFVILKLGTRLQGGESKRSADNFGHCYLFDIYDLEFLVTSADCRKRGKTIEAPSGDSTKTGPLGPDSLLLSHPASRC